MADTRTARADLASLAGPRRRAVRLPRLRLWRNLPLVGGLTLLGLLALLALCAPLVAWHSPNRTFPDVSLFPPSAYFPFGTDSVGRDVFSRVLHGGRVSLGIAVPTVTLAILLGLLIGVPAGYLGGRVDAAIMRVLDVFFAFPALLLAMLMVTVFGASVRNLVIAMGIIYAPRMARIVRAPVIAVKEREFVEAARAIGCRPWAIVSRHLLPNAFSPVVVEAGLALGQVILTETALSFLGLGPPPPDPTWGAMVSQSRQFMEFAPWAVLAPGFAIVATTSAFLLTGHGVRIALDPRQRLG